MEVGYWGIQGLMRPIRDLLKYLDADYTEYNPQSREEWGVKKQQLIDSGFALPNLPYLIDGDVKISESWAVPRYIIGKYHRNDLVGKNSKDGVNIIMVMGVVRDLASTFASIITSEDYSQKIT